VEELAHEPVVGLAADEVLRIAAVAAEDWEALRRASTGQYSCIIVGAGPAGLAAAQVGD
jgi:NADPH-dependent 2,4-dienoyl-CoA reductase/sulfur reductase-like enzyme